MDSFVKNLRTRSTVAENVLWNKLRSNKIGKKFRRQVKLGNYIVDFCSFSDKLVIELDGEVHTSIYRKNKDYFRTTYLSEKGYKIIRFWNAEVIDNPDLVVEKIRSFLTPQSTGASLSVDTERGMR